MEPVGLGIRPYPRLTIQRQPKIAQSEQTAPRFGHGDHGKEKGKKPWKLLLWGIADVLLLGGSVFTADLIVPDPHDSPAITQPNQPHPSEPHDDHTSRWERAFQISGLATGIHLLSHVGLAGGWFLYGRHRGKNKLDHQNKSFQDFQQYAQKLAKQGGEFQVIPMDNGSFQIVKCTEAAKNTPTEPLKQPTLEQTPATGFATLVNRKK